VKATLAKMGAFVKTPSKISTAAAKQAGRCEKKYIYLFVFNMLVSFNTPQGPTCEDDVNECARFVGTDLGCQNGATCSNKPGSYE
jgi:hypothetical protein